MTAVAAYFPLVPGSKLPAVKAWQRVTPGQFARTGCDGRNLQAEEFLIDADPRNYPDGRDVLAELWQKFLSVAPTRTVKTPRGGYHLYYSKPAGVNIKKTQADFPGVDFLSSGQFAVADGSRTVAACWLKDDNKTFASETVDGVYELVADLPVANVPQALLDALQERGERLETGSVDFSLLAEPQFVSECQVAAPAVSGQHGDETTLKLALRGRDLGLPKESVFAAMRDHWNFRCEPEWSDSELLRKVDNAYQYGRNTMGVASVEAKFTPDMATPVQTNVVSIETFQHDKVVSTVYQKQLLLDEKTFLPKLTHANVVYYLREDPAWKGRILYNQFSDAIEIKGRPDWRKNQTNSSDDISDYDISFFQSWFSANDKIRLEVSADKLWSALFAAATPYHPVRDYLDSLVWDNEPRLDTFLPDTTRCVDTPYTRVIGAKFLLSAVARIYEPGCKQDHLPVLESIQGEKKSQWVEALGGAWASTGELVQGDKDTYQNMRGKWIIELPEIDATFTKAQIAWLKKVISTAKDTYRPSYARRNQSIPRESVFVATINPGATGRYLKDSENRRYWPVSTGNLNVALLKKTRDQYFAEAVHRYKQGEIWWIEDAKLNKLIKNEQEQRREIDPWVDLMRGWTSAQPASGFTFPEACGALGMVAKEIQSRTRERVYAVLRELGYEYRSDYAGGRWLPNDTEKDWEDLI